MADGKMISQGHKKGQVQRCPGIGFLISSAKMNRTDTSSIHIQADNTPAIQNNTFKTLGIVGTESGQPANRDGSRCAAESVVLNDGSCDSSTSCAPCSSANDSGCSASVDYHSSKTNSQKHRCPSTSSGLPQQQNRCSRSGDTRSRDRRRRRSRDRHSTSRDRRSRSIENHSRRRDESSGGSRHRKTRSRDTRSRDGCSRSQDRRSRDRKSRSRDRINRSRDRGSRSRDRYAGLPRYCPFRGREGFKGKHSHQSKSREMERRSHHRRRNSSCDDNSSDSSSSSSSHQHSRRKSSRRSLNCGCDGDYENECSRQKYDFEDSFGTPRRYSSSSPHHRSRSWRRHRRYSSHSRTNVSPLGRRRRSRNRSRSGGMLSRSGAKIQSTPPQKKQPPKGSPPTIKTLHSVSRLLFGGYQRGEADRTKMHKTLVLSTASNLQKTDTRDVFRCPEECENLDHMTHMSLSKDHDQLLCMWSVRGTSLQQVQILHVSHHSKTRCGELPLDFTLSDHVLQTWGSIASLCWADCPWVSKSNVVLYTVNHRSRVNMSVAYIVVMDSVTEGGFHFQYADFLLGNRLVWACAWNAWRQRFGAGLDRGCQVVDINTRQCWELGSQGSKVLAQAFSETDGGHLLYCGVQDGSLLMHDVRRGSRMPIVLMSHRRGHLWRHSICDLKLSPDERFVYAGDISGQIRKWDLRICRTVLTYEGLCNQQRRLPFHIDDSQSVLYSAGTDCYTKIWSLKNGRLLHSIPPPYQASPSTVPAVQFCTQWAGLAGNMGLLMGAHMNLHLYSSGV